MIESMPYPNYCFYFSIEKMTCMDRKLSRHKVNQF